MSKNKYFRDKRIIVIGGSEGIGRAVAVELVLRGAHVVIASRHDDKLKNTLKDMEKVRRDPGQVLAAVSLDVMDFEQTRRQLEAAMKSYGTPDILINSAGYAHPGYLEDLDVAVLRKMMDVNYFGIVHAVKAVLPALRKAGKGHIVNVASMAGYLGLFGYTGYCASKYAVLGFSKALRHELEPFHIAVSVVCPPNTDTPGFEKENRIKPREVLALEQRVKTAKPEAIARAMLRAIPRRPFLIHPTAGAKLVYHANRFLPAAVMDHFLRRPSHR